MDIQGTHEGEAPWVSCPGRAIWAHGGSAPCWRAPRQVSGNLSIRTRSGWVTADLRCVRPLNHFGEMLTESRPAQTVRLTVSQGNTSRGPGFDSHGWELSSLLNTPRWVKPRLGMEPSLTGFTQERGNHTKVRSNPPWATCNQRLCCRLKLKTYVTRSQQLNHFLCAIIQTSIWPQNVRLRNVVVIIRGNGRGFNPAGRFLLFLCFACVIQVCLPSACHDPPTKHRLDAASVSLPKKKVDWKITTTWCRRAGANEKWCRWLKYSCYSDANTLTFSF